jgi:hypothetical protein
MIPENRKTQAAAGAKKSSAKMPAISHKNS